MSNKKLTSNLNIHKTVCYHFKVKVTKEEFDGVDEVGIMRLFFLIRNFHFPYFVYLRLVPIY